MNNFPSYMDPISKMASDLPLIELQNKLNSIENLSVDFSEFKVSSKEVETVKSGKYTIVTVAVAFFSIKDEIVKLVRKSIPDIRQNNDCVSIENIKNVVTYFEFFKDLEFCREFVVKSDKASYQIIERAFSPFLKHIFVLINSVAVGSETVGEFDLDKFFDGEL